MYNLVRTQPAVWFVWFDRTLPADWSKCIGLKEPCLLMVKMYWFDRTLPADLSICIGLTEPCLLIGRDVLLWLNPACWLLEMYWFDRPCLLIGQDVLVRQNPACWLIEMYWFDRTLPAEYLWERERDQISYVLANIKYYLYNLTTIWKTFQCKNLYHA